MIAVFQIILRDDLDWGGEVAEDIEGRDRFGIFFGESVAVDIVYKVFTSVLQHACWCPGETQTLP